METIIIGTTQLYGIYLEFSITLVNKYNDYLQYSLEYEQFRNTRLQWGNNPN